MDREEIIDKHKCLLDKMKEDRIFSICFENNAVYLNEQCDDYFSHQLTKEDCLELSSLFGELATVMNRRQKNLQERSTIQRDGRIVEEHT